MKEWIKWGIALVAVTLALLSGLARAEGIYDCLPVAKQALSIARALDRGFLFNPQEPLVQEVRAAYLDTLGQDNRPERAAQKVLEQCAFNFGLLRRVGSAPPPAAEELLEKLDKEFALAASGQHSLDENIMREQECNWKQMQAYGVKETLRLEGLDKESFLRDYPIPPSWSDASKKWGMEMLDRALAFKGGSFDFRDSEYDLCMK